MSKLSNISYSSEVSFIGAIYEISYKEKLNTCLFTGKTYYTNRGIKLYF